MPENCSHVGFDAPSVLNLLIRKSVVTELRHLRDVCRASEGEKTMSDNSGGSGVLGVLVGAMLVIFIGAAVLMATGEIGRAHV